MEKFEVFERYLRDGLMHLYDPSYDPPELIRTVLGCSPKQGVSAIQSALIQSVENMKPNSEIPPNARIRRFYELLSYRYIQELTQVQTAQRLNITPRHLRREQQQAIHMLAQRLWEQRPVGEPVDDTQSTAWRSQVHQELVSLQQSAPGAIADVNDTINNTIKVGHPLASKHGVRLVADNKKLDLIAAIHPSLLSQILVTAVEKLVQCMPSGEINIVATAQDENVAITITGAPVIVDEAPQSDLIREILAVQGGSIEIEMDDDQLEFSIALPLADSVQVLVVDDNHDLVHWYQRYVTQTRYQIAHVAEGQRAFEAIANSPPDIIVLDVMLPDIDGWELLTRLHEHPRTRSIPVVVCSVVKREELAMALGAAVYLPKPVRRQQFVQALDQALSLAPATASKSKANSAISG
jgi:CheY-like chemotaxis protein